MSSYSSNLESFPPSPRTPMSPVSDFVQSNSPYQPYPPKFVTDPFGIVNVHNAIPVTPPASPLLRPNIHMLINPWQASSAAEKLECRARDQDTSDPWYGTGLGLVSSLPDTSAPPSPCFLYLSTFPAHVSPHSDAVNPMSSKVITTIRYLPVPERESFGWFATPFASPSPSTHPPSSGTPSESGSRTAPLSLNDHQPDSFHGNDSEFWKISPSPSNIHSVHDSPFHSSNLPLDSQDKNSELADEFGQESEEETILSVVLF